VQRILGVVSGKGGVGKTTIVSNLGVVLHDLGQEVTVVDGDLTTSNLCLHLGIYHFPSGLQQVLEGSKSIYEVVIQHPFGVKVVPSSLALSSDVKSERLMDSIRDLSGWVLLDSPPGLHKQFIDVIRACDEILLVVNPELPSLVDAMKVVRIAEELEKELLGVIVNRVGKSSYELSKEEIEGGLDVPVLGMIPEDWSVRKSVFLRIPVVVYDPLCPASIELKRIGARLVGVEYKVPRFVWLKRLLRLR
jgi:septum site-determining protein MinD